MSTQGQIQPGHIPISVIRSNTELTLIQIIEDKLRLILLQHLADVESGKRWQFPLGVLLALIPMFLTSDFKDFAWIDKTTWRAFFLFATVAAIAWLVLAIRATRKAGTPDQLVERIKNSKEA